MTEDREPERRSSTVLLVEGDVLMRMPVAAYLRECGYRVFEAVSADEALEVLNAAELKIDVIFVSAGVDGFALVSQARKKREGIKTVLAGTTKRTAIAAGDLCRDGPKLAKPYHPQIIERQIRSLLATRTETAT